MVDCFVSVLTDRLRTSLVIVAHARLVPSAGVCCHSVFGSAEASRVVQSACHVGHSLLSRQSQALVTMSVLASRHSRLSSVRTKAHSGCFCYYSELGLLHCWYWSTGKTPSWRCSTAYLVIRHSVQVMGHSWTVTARYSSVLGQSSVTVLRH